MNWLNASVQCFDHLSMLDSGMLVGSVKCSRKDVGKYAVDDFAVGVFLNVRGSINAKDENPLDLGKRLEFKLRLSENFGERRSYDLSEWKLDLSDKSLRDPFYIMDNKLEYVDSISVVKVGCLFVETLGDYVLKLLVRCEGDEKYEVQAVRGLVIR